MNNFAYQNNCNRQGNNLNDCKNNEIYTDYLIKKDYPNNLYVLLVNFLCINFVLQKERHLCVF